VSDHYSGRNPETGCSLLALACLLAFVVVGIILAVSWIK
jgi:hypothetical protein